MTLKPCGTRAAYSRHRYRGEEPCPACFEANADYNSRYRGKRKTEYKPRNPIAMCGTDSGYYRHRNKNETPCRECKRAHAERQRLYSGWMPRDRSTQAETIVDVLITHDRWMTSENVIDWVQDIHPNWPEQSIRRNLQRLIKADIVQSRIAPDGMQFRAVDDAWELVNG